MSWSFTGIGNPVGILAQAKTQLGNYKNAEPEETIKNSVIGILETSLGAFPDDVAVQVEAYGSQTGAAGGKATNQLTLKITPIHGFTK